MSAILAPSGWGFLPGTPIAGVTVDELPDMPMLRFLERDKRNAAVLAMLKDRPGLANSVKCSDLMRKYGLPQSTSSLLIKKALS